VTIGKNIALEPFKALVILLITLFLMVTARTDILAEDSVGLSYISPGGGVVLYAAIQNGYFKEDGLKVSPVPADINSFKSYIDQGLIVGGEIDYQIYKIADGKVGITAGLFSGFLELVGRDPKGLDNIIVVSENNGSGAAVAAARQLRTIGIDTDKVIWIEAPLNQLQRIVDIGDATLFARFELKRTDKGHGSGHGAGHAEGHAGGHAEGAEHKAPEGSHGAQNHGESGAHNGHPSEGKGHAHGEKGAEASNEMKVMFSASASLPHDDGSEPSANPHAKHTSAHHFFDSFVALSRDLYSKDPAKAAAITRNYIRGAIWVGENIEAAAEIGIKNKVWSGDKESLVAELKRYMWMPGVKHAKEHLKVYIHEWIARGLFPKGTNENEVFDKIFIQALPDVN
jgi:ABC-type nitrate/sulfonate/bicarbonate transport system substrate-binding protein